MIRKSTTTTPSGFEHFRELDGLADLVAVAKSIDESSPQVRMRASSVQGDAYFTGTNSLAEAINQCELGWQQGRQKIVDAVAQISVQDILTHKDEEVSFIFDVAGDEPDVDRYLAGEPEDMVAYYLEDARQGKDLKLIVNASQHAFVRSDAIIRRGIAIAVALEAVSAAGYGVQLELAEKCAPSGYYGGASTLEYRIPVIGSGQYMDVDALSFSIVSPSFLRRLVFALNENEPADIRDEFGFYEGHGYGMPQNIEPKPGEKAVVINKDEGLLGSDEQIEVFAKEIANRLLNRAKAQLQGDY